MCQQNGQNFTPEEINMFMDVPVSPIVNPTSLPNDQPFSEFQQEFNDHNVKRSD
jgi:hypothetical protein